MKHKERVLIMGRPNVGKSTFINRLIGKKTAITLDVPGVTRDFMEFPQDWNGKHFTVVDSGGIFGEPSAKEEPIQEKLEHLIFHQLEIATKIIFLTDFTAGYHPQDAVVAKHLRNYKDKVIVVVNKVDDFSNRNMITEFYKLGLGTPIPISSIHGTGIGDLLDILVEDFGVGTPQEDTDFHVAFVGKPNVGKSSLLNAILEEERVIVDSVAGTTRDSVEAYYNYYNQRFCFIDTAGLRKKSKVEDGIEYYSNIRTDRAIDQANIVIVLINPEPFMTEQDKKIIDKVLTANKPMIVFVNKWDLTERSNEIQNELKREAIKAMPALENYPFIFGSATERIHLNQLFDKIPEIVANAQKRISTPKINDFMTRVIKHSPPPAKVGERIKVFYATQVGAAPPKFLFFVNKAEHIDKPYTRFVENRLRLEFPEFFGVPIQIFFKSRSKIDIKLKPRTKKKSTEMPVVPIKRAKKKSKD